jgi:hypothetical protein
MFPFDVFFDPATVAETSFAGPEADPEPSDKLDK